MNLTDNFIDDDGDILTMTATYSKNPGVELAIPEGIFTKPAEFEINVPSTLIEDTGTYNISIIVSDPYLASLTCWFTLDITNAAPYVVTAPKDEPLVHGRTLIINLTSNFEDTDNDPITMTANYSLNG
jgi:hypothetical protein